MDPATIAALVVLLAKELGPELLKLIERGSTHPDTPPDTASRVRELLAGPLPTELDAARLRAEMGQT